MDSELDQQFGGDPFLAPGPIRRRHLHNQVSNSGRHGRSSARSRFQPPEQSIRLAMPSNERRGPHDGEDPTPIDQSRQRYQRNPRRIVSPTGFHLPFDVQGQLFFQKQVLGSEMGMRPNRGGGETRVSPQRRTTMRMASRERDRLISRQSYRISRQSTPREGPARFRPDLAGNRAGLEFSRTSASS